MPGRRCAARSPFRDVGAGGRDAAAISRRPADRGTARDRHPMSTRCRERCAAARARPPRPCPPVARSCAGAWRSGGSTRSSASTRMCRRSPALRDCPELGPVARTRLLILEQLADLGQREPGVVTKTADETQPVKILGVVESVGALGPRGGGEQVQLLVVPDGTRREPGLGRDLVDPEQAPPRAPAPTGRVRRYRSRIQSKPDLAVYVNVDTGRSGRDGVEHLCYDPALTACRRDAPRGRPPSSTDRASAPLRFGEHGGPHGHRYHQAHRRRS